MFRAMKMYNPHSGGKGIEKVLGIIGLFLFVLGIIFRWFIIKGSDWSDVFFAFAIAAWYCPFLFF